MNSVPHKKIWRHTGLRIGGSALALALLLYFLPLATLESTLRRLPPRIWILVLAGYLAAHVAGIHKWRLMVNTGGAALSFAQALRCYFSGLFSNLFLPSLLGGDVVRATLALRAGKNNAGVILGSVADRLIDFLALAFLAGLGALLAPTALDSRTRRVFWIFGAAVLVVIAICALVAFLLPARKFSFKMRRRVVRVRLAARCFRRHPLRVGGAVCLGLIVQSSFIALTAAVAGASGLHLAFRAWLFAWPLAKLSAVLPFTQGGIGVREAALAVLLVPFGAPAAMTVAVGLAWEAVILSGGLIAGATALLSARLTTKSSARRIEADVSAQRSPLSRSEELD